jgi:hypothetical protein
MKVWRDVLAGIGLAIIIIIVIVATGNYTSNVRYTEVTATKKIYHEESDSVTMEFENKQRDKVYSIDDYVCPIGTEAVIYYDKNTGELLKITTRTIL